MPPRRHSRSEKAMRRTAPGCQSAGAPDGASHSIRSVDRLRSCTHGANTLTRTRPASSISNPSTCGWYCMNAGFLAPIGVPARILKCIWRKRTLGLRVEGRFDDGELLLRALAHNLERSPKSRVCIKRVGGVIQVGDHG